MAINQLNINDDVELEVLRDALLNLFNFEDDMIHEDSIITPIEIERVAQMDPNQQIAHLAVVRRATNTRIDRLLAIQRLCCRLDPNFIPQV